MTDSSTENMLEEQHSNHSDQWVTQESPKAITSIVKCWPFTPDSSLLKWQCLATRFGLKGLSDGTLHPWKTVLCLIRRTVVFTPMHWIKRAIWSWCVQNWAVAGASGWDQRAQHARTDAGGRPAAPGFAVQAGDNALPLQLVARGAVVLTPRAKVGTIQALEAPVGRHGQGRATLFWKRKQRLLETCYPPFPVMHIWGITQK